MPLQQQRAAPVGMDGSRDYEVKLPDGRSFTIEKELIQHCLEVAQLVSPNSNLKIILGKPGSGSFKLLNTDCIVLDPLFVKESVSKARFVTGHEAAHDAISCSMTEIGLSRAQANELGGKVGYQYIHNILEDPVVNDFMCKRVPPLRNDTILMYDEQFMQENAAMMTPEAAQFSAALGYVPKYVQFGSEIMRDWHTGDYSRKLDSEVAKVLPLVIDKAREVIETYPQDGSLEREQVLDMARKRFLLVHEYIYPDVERLIKMDIDNERRRQQANQESDKQGKPGQKGKQGQGKGQPGQGQGQPGQGQPQPGQGQPGQQGQPQPGQGGQPNDSGAPDPHISDQTRKEIEKLRNDANKEQAKQTADKLKDLKDQVEQSRERQRELEKEIEKALTDPSDRKKDEKDEQREETQDEQRQGASQPKPANQDEREERDKQQQPGGAGEEREEKQDEKEQDSKGSGEEKDQEKQGAGGKDDEKKDGKKSPSPSPANKDRIEERREEKRPELDAAERLQRERLYEEAVQKELEKTLEKSFENKDDAKAVEEMLDKHDKNLDREIEKRLEQENANKESPPFDPSKLSDRAKRELDRAFDQMSPDQKRELEDMAKKALKEIEDQVNREMNPGQDYAQPSSQSRQQQPPQPHQLQQPKGPYQPPDFNQINQAAQNLESQRMANLSEWDREFERIAPKLDEMHQRILKKLLKDRYPDWDPCHPVGQELDVFTAMQAEADPRLMTQMFKNRIPPTEHSWAVEIIVDTSPSMASVARPTFQAIVFMAELLHRLKFESEISEFSAQPILHKTWDDKIVDENIRKELSKLLQASGGTTRDGTATEEAYDRLRKSDAKHKLLVVFSDAQSMEPAKLCAVIERIGQDGDTVVVHYGVGPYTNDNVGFYPFSFGGLAIDGGSKPQLTSAREELSEERRMGEMVAGMYALDQEEQRAVSQAGADFYETFFESIVDILLKPEQYLREAKKHVPAGQLRGYMRDYQD